MKNLILNNKIALITGFIFVLLFTLSGVLTNTFQNIRADREILVTYLPAFPTGEKLVERSAEGFLMQPDGSKIIKAFDVYINSETVGMIYVVETKGRNDGLQFAFGFETATKKTVGYKIIQNNETPSYFERITLDFFSQLIDKNLDDVSFNLTLVSGATTSSSAIERMLKLARLQFGVDIGWEVPSVVLNLVSKQQDFSDLINTKYKYTFAYAENDVEVTNVVTLERNPAGATPYYSFVSSTVEATDVVKRLFEIEASKPENRVQAYVVSVDGLNLVVRGIGYAGSITASVGMNVNGTIATFVVTSENETYPVYNGLDPITELPSRYIDDQATIDDSPTTSSATITSKAIKEMFKIALLYGTEVGFSG